MISPQAQAIKVKLFQRKDLDYLLNTDINVQRQDWEASALNARLCEGVGIQAISADNIKGELILPQAEKPCVILYFHGGGLTLGSCITHRKLASHIAGITNIPVFVHDYPLAPENPYPAALNFSKQVYLWLLEQGYREDQIIFGGDSSGCALALSLILKLKCDHDALPKGVFLLSPMLDFTVTGKTIKTNAKIDPCLFEEDICMSAGLYCGGALPENQFITPLNGSFTGFPPMLVQAGGSEMLLDDAVRLKEKASLAGVSVCLEVWEEMWHVFQGKIGEVPEAEQALNHVNTFLEKIFAE